MRYLLDTHHMDMIVAQVALASPSHDVRYNNFPPSLKSLFSYLPTFSTYQNEPHTQVSHAMRNLNRFLSSNCLNIGTPQVFTTRRPLSRSPILLALSCGVEEYPHSYEKNPKFGAYLPTMTNTTVLESAKILGATTHQGMASTRLCSRYCVDLPPSFQILAKGPSLQLSY